MNLPQVSHSRIEDKDEGFVIKGEDIGMRLMAFEYWKCAETGLAMKEKGIGSVKFVIAEALPKQGPNQINMFIENHGGPGVQHIGLHTSDIISAVAQLQHQGVEFNEPPYTYYTEVGQLKEMVAIGMDVNSLKDTGILLDTEADSHLPSKLDDCSILEKSSPYRYLMQKFTRPLFEKDTFFLEVIQRTGARGFGSGNITALWRSVQAFLQKRQQEQEQDKLK
ncbi:4-hydroxyphenylpyruvate dioxygenase-like protein isoform X2 [Pomacea canaliculata]|uniref:4-hydroxyphenylpyruvate dioxygenase-like protein isoform X2 n=1 Tax=Pomacea canaliculata TaxID=400727 RepID=UPI000D726E97|nr:4-hydroxyphenylpyruvate dioxygenase-like protein isoform X2 [Pomacea canaliculata]